ncbi:DUF3027 domain-containing protein [Leucobacter aridicollis]|uniref:DUF3027 domain-containing protein n=1 Tax=Leucobacter aridicollis TaxID=283878 RepID=UPI002107ED7C|nr:DUF3027 domain-containing protein [Leucobacter aridicollis]UTX52607.1 DUF3027 domain-containing protein [Leucobacter aridicollis]
MSEQNAEQSAIDGSAQPDETTEARTPIEPDAVLLTRESRAQARAALEEITDAKSIGGDAGYEVNDERTVTVFFESLLAGYPGWRWAAAIARVDEDAPVTVLEVELLPGEGSMLAPEWVPWSERLAQYRDAQSRQSKEAAAEHAAAEQAAAELADLDDADEDALENDYADYEDDLDGVDLGEGDDEDGHDDADDDADDDVDDDDGDEDGDDLDNDEDDDDDDENDTDDAHAAADDSEDADDED